MPPIEPTTEPLRARKRFATIALALAIALPALIAVPAEADGFPTWDEVEAARSSESAKQGQISRLTGAISQLQQATSAAAARAEKSGADYQKAQDALDDASGAYDKLARELDDARTEAKRSAETVGQVAASLAKPGAGSPTVTLLSGEGDPGEILRGLGLSNQVGRKVARLQDDAVQAARVVTSTSNQAKVAKEARQKQSKAAAAALEEATSASRAAAAAEDAERSNLGVMQAQLATLRNDALSIEEGYQEGVAARAAAAAAEAARVEKIRQAAAAAEAERRRAAAANPVTPARPSPPVPSTGGGSGGGSSSANGWTRPITSYSFYQAYGYRMHPVYHTYKLHAGADFSAGCGTPIYATSAGTVTYAGAYGGYGNLIIIDHGNGVTSAYGHVFPSGIYVRAGQRVSEGQNIAGVGNAGVSTGCHLHFEVRRGGIATDPMAFLRTKGVG
ncbi:metalloendopeptidase [Frondihabitans sucicola]|uniref:Metalloendopeptidase n=1 Tax=Frondihabitans sucicola TaxID=1268041 RepID=A0ABM8GJC9_9MICO|nr:M23 family metallopeptidase [Frondihabitans sucicola]BDZ48278.1 metalloendopeptidase [Frondihabitans sucicola]